MSRSVKSKRHIRKLGTIGNSEQPSYYLTLPIDYIRALGWESGQKLVTRKRGDKLVLETVKE